MFNTVRKINRSGASSTRVVDELLNRLDDLLMEHEQMMSLVGRELPKTSDELRSIRGMLDLVRREISDVDERGKKRYAVLKARMTVLENAAKAAKEE